MALGDVGQAANGIELVGHPYNEDDIERRRIVVEELGHDGLHAWKRRRKTRNVFNLVGKSKKLHQESPLEAHSRIISLLFTPSLLLVTYQLTIITTLLDGQAHALNIMTSYKSLQRGRHPNECTISL